MIKGGVCPVDRVVARFARRGESGRGVCRVGGSRVVLLVAGIAQSAIQRVIVVDVAIGAAARWHRMRISQREPGGRVIKLAIRPLNGVVAGIASRREPGRSVCYGRGRIVVVGLVTGYTGRARQVVIIVDVAVGTGPRWHRVISGQREAGAVVIERCIRPGRGVMALIARLREVCRDVVGIRRSLIVLQVATDAGRAVQAVVVIDVAIGADARRHGVQAGEGEAGAGVVKRRVHPVRGVVTGIARLREVRCDVVRIGGCLVILQVTAHAGRAVQAVVIVDVAIGAGSRRNRVHSG